jgi:hypothetical protein
MSSIRAIRPRGRPRPRSVGERQRLHAWASFLRTDRDWDWTDLLGVIDFKLDRMQEVIADGWGAKRAVRAGEIRAVRRLIKRVIGNRYLEDLTRPHRARWGRVSWREGERVPGGVRIELYFPRAKTAREKARAHRDYDRLAKCAHEQRQAEINQLFDLMARHIQGWWE